MFSALLCVVPVTMYSQSSMEYQPGTTIEVESGADICADNIVVNGTFLGSGSRCSGPLSVEGASAEDTPKEFSLSQNYPNPFNPSTTIRYGLPRPSHVTLSVFNALGQQVAVLHDGEQGAGYHEVQFEGKSLASGLYLYRMQAGPYVETKKLLLVH